MTNVVLISNYELGRQPFGLASPAASLREAGANVRCLDLAVEPADLAALRQADVVGFYVPMHMGTRMAAPIIPQVKKLNPQAHLVCFGLYAPMNEEYLRGLGVSTVLGGEFEAGLLSVVRRVQNGTAAGPQPEPVVSLARQDFRVPDRRTLPGLEKYAQLMVEPGQTRLVGYTEASRGCKHVCRHCPVVPVYGGRFRVVPQPVVLADIRQQVEAGAQHITFGDPDFFNGPG
ncbi:MAG: radical SAM protein, partial [Chloroflexi bacterium]